MELENQHKGLRTIAKWCLAGGLAIAVGACQSTSEQRTTAPQPAPSSPLKAANTSATTAGSTVGRIATEVVTFARSRVDVPSGTQIINWRGGAIVGIGCGRRHRPPTTYDGANFLKHPRYARSFNRAMQSVGVSVANTSKSLFHPKSGAKEAVYAIGAVINHIWLDLCADVEPMHHIPTGRVSGSATISVEWQVFSVPLQRVVYKKSIKGSAQISGDGPPNGHIVLMNRAFGSAARQLGLDEGFRSTIRLGGAALTANTGKRSVSSGRPVRIATHAALGSPISPARWKQRIAATVTVRVLNAHGSGFFITRQGHLVTNHHVVGDASRVSIRLSDGRNIVGRVVARDRRRDVALIKVAAINVQPMPIRYTPAQIGEEVYAIGSPLKVSLQSTVSRGIVSSVRKTRFGRTYIQSDVNINSGSSGGPLIDRYGNVIGISVAGLKQKGLTVGINLFIPIREAIAILRKNVAAN